MTLLIWLVAWELLLRYGGNIVTGAPLAMLLIMVLLLGAGLTGIALSRRGYGHTVAYMATLTIYLGSLPRYALGLTAAVESPSPLPLALTMAYAIVVPAALIIAPMVDYVERFGYPGRAR